MSDLERRLGALRATKLLQGLNDHELVAILERSTVKRYASGQRVLSELEPGDAVLFILEGRGAVTVGGSSKVEPTRLAEVAPGDVVGEVTVLTGDLRSASITALEDMAVLLVSRRLFESLLERFPSVALRCYRSLAQRLEVTERLIGKILDRGVPGEEKQRALTETAPGEGALRRTSFREGVVKAYRELVKGRDRDLSFLMLMGFCLAVLAARAAVLAVRSLGYSIEGTLKASYVVGLLLLCSSILFALNLHRPYSLRALAALYGIGMALLLNGMSALIAFDVFYRHDWSPDPAMSFSAEMLYDRSEGLVFLATAAAFLLQVAFLRRFYLRIVYHMIALAQRRWG